MSTLAAQETITGELQHDSETRNYRLYIPSNYDAENMLPLVFNLHGYTSNAAEQQAYSGMNGIAETEDFLVCYPNGIARSWSVGWNFDSNADDVGFIEALIDELSINYSIDPNRIYVCGMSNGGFMSYRLACELNDKIAAIASITGSMPPNYECPEGRSVPILQMHGTSDLVVPYAGNGTFTRSIEDVIQYWVDRNDCNSEPRYTEIENSNLLDLSTVEKFSYDQCTNGAEVWFYKITNGGHTWPGSPLPSAGTNYDIEANIEIWDFFNRFTLEGPTDNQNITSEIRWRIFPNPSNGDLNILPPTNDRFTLRIKDGLGRDVIRQDYNGTISTEFTQLPVGMYWLILQQGSDRQVLPWHKSR